MTDPRNRHRTRTETAVLAGGCFWGMEDLIRKRPGVIDTRVGYTGGDVPNATYRNHGRTPRRSRSCSTRRRRRYRDLLEFFFQIHDPTTRNRQGNDIGIELPLGDLPADARAGGVAHDTIADVDASGLWPGPAVTEVDARRPVLGGRGRAPGLPGAHPVGLHVPLRAPGLEAAQARRGDRGLGLDTTHTTAPADTSPPGPFACLVAHDAAHRPRPRHEVDRPVGARRHQLAQPFAEAVSRRRLERHGVRGGHPLAAEERGPVSSKSANRVGTSTEAASASTRPALANRQVRPSGVNRSNLAPSSSGGGRRVEFDGGQPEPAHELHATRVVPDVGADHAAGDGDARHLGERRVEVGHEVEHEPRHHDVDRRVVERQRRGIRPVEGDPVAEIGDGDLEEALRWLDPVDGGGRARVEDRRRSALPCRSRRRASAVPAASAATPGTGVRPAGSIARRSARTRGPAPTCRDPDHEPCSTVPRRAPGGQAGMPSPSSASCTIVSPSRPGMPRCCRRPCARRGGPRGRPSGASSRGAPRRWS